MARLIRWGTLILCILHVPQHSEAKEDPKPDSPEFPAFVMQRIDDLYRGRKSQGVMEMQVKTKHWTRTMRMQSWSLGKDYSLVRILKPRKEKGTATLKAQKNLFIYLNKTGRTVKISSGMMGGSWMGSHFTNDDLLRHSRLSEDYTIAVGFTGDLDGIKVYRFDLKAKPNAAVVWGSQQIVVRQRDLLPLSQKFFDEDGKPMRLLLFSNHRKIGERMMPMTMTMRPLDASKEFTEIRVMSINFEVPLTPQFFSLQRLKAM
jgi:hypothetical protein